MDNQIDSTSIQFAKDIAQNFKNIEATLLKMGREIVKFHNAKEPNAYLNQLT
jgi:hypothetical protein